MLILTNVIVFRFVQIKVLEDVQVYHNYPLPIHVFSKSVTVNNMKNTIQI